MATSHFGKPLSKLGTMRNEKKATKHSGRLNTGMAVAVAVLALTIAVIFNYTVVKHAESVWLSKIG